MLIADDNRDGVESMIMLLILSGHEVHVAHSGAEALELAGRVRPQLGVLDIGVPDVNGYQVPERSRSEAWGDCSGRRSRRFKSFHPDQYFSWSFFTRARRNRRCGSRQKLLTVPDAVPV